MLPIQMYIFQGGIWDHELGVIHMDYVLYTHLMMLKGNVLS